MRAGSLPAEGSWCRAGGSLGLRMDLMGRAKNPHFMRDFLPTARNFSKIKKLNFPAASSGETRWIRSAPDYQSRMRTPARDSGLVVRNEMIEIWHPGNNIASLTVSDMLWRIATTLQQHLHPPEAKNTLKHHPPEAKHTWSGRPPKKPRARGFKITLPGDSHVPDLVSTYWETDALKV